ncbi:1-acyl-sn-glycerol-3-phosphate acyltransferase [Blastococcus sp. Marseille-P5729]|uniref:lysophospholipid acyltransferase family protein n=1 Tax=Blastococcus sp. Marseille-P5729 TaxID=2086582 RepID=UPI000D10C62C|nr:lysophospholipid acyltransferase family protein [Blastococcus sp. Marseille-P5729]
MPRFESCPHLCARQGITRRHEAGLALMARRVLAILQVLIVGMCGIALRSTTDRLRRRRRTPAYVARTYRRLIEACGIELDIVGVRRTFADRGEPVLVVGNHVSWLDVMAYGAVQPVTMVSKKEIGQWPLIGDVAKAAGTIFIDRENYRAVDEVRKEVGRRMRAGEVVATFPEATTTCGRGMAPLFPAMFQAAIDVGVPVQPVAFSWLDRNGEITTAGAYVGEQPLLDSIKAIISQRGLTLRIEILPRIMPKHVRPIDDRKALRTAAAESIATALDQTVGEWEAHLRPATCQAARIELPVLSDPLAELESLPPVEKPAVRKAGAA